MNLISYTFLGVAFVLAIFALLSLRKRPRAPEEEVPEEEGVSKEEKIRALFKEAEEFEEIWRKIRSENPTTSNDALTAWMLFDIREEIREIHRGIDRLSSALSGISSDVKVVLYGVGILFALSLAILAAVA